jgi:uncharacterized membrane protein YphA (DoxX/SURF4 family)
MNFIIISMQLIVALGLLNVWFLRNKQATNYRGGSAKTLKEEFLAYGLPVWVYFLVGGLKVLGALVLLIGIFQPELITPVAGLLVVLMLGALAMHLKVKDPLIKSLPALAMLALNLSLVLLTI